jgi:tetratricopeptide (TPR) repeat protein
MSKNEDTLKEGSSVRKTPSLESGSQELQELKKQITEELMKITDIDEDKLSGYIKFLENLDDTTLDNWIRGLVTELEERALPFLGLLGRSSHIPLSQKALKYLGSLQSQKSVDILTQIAETHPDKKVRKSARTNLYRLQSAGLAVKRPLDPEVAKSRERKVKHKPYQALMSNVDGSGSQLIIVAREMFAGDLHILQSVIHEEEGLKECRAMRGLTKKSFARLMEEMIERMRQEGAPDLTLVEIDYNYGMRLIVEAEKLNQTLGTEISPAYLSVKELFLESADLTVPPPIYQKLDAEKIKTQPHLLRGSAELISHPLLESWIFDIEKIKSYVDALKKQEETVLELSPQFIKEREEAVFDQALSTLFDEKHKLLYKERLEKTAYILFTKGEIEEAKKALAAALALDPQSRVPVKNHPLIVELVRRNITFLKEAEAGQLTEEGIERYYEERKKAREQSSLIITDLGF